MSMALDIDSICARLAELEAERGALNEQLERLLVQRAQAMVCGSVSPIAANSTAAEKIILFRRLFAGRSDVFPVRWENRNTGTSGYAPACADEWVRGADQQDATRDGIQDRATCAADPCLVYECSALNNGTAGTHRKEYSHRTMIHTRRVAARAC
jgi:hypothetical protein